MVRPDRTLSDEDVKAIAEELERRFADRFTRAAGLRVLQLAWRGFVLAIVLLAASYFAHGGGR